MPTQVSFPDGSSRSQTPANTKFAGGFGRSFCRD